MSLTVSVEVPPRDREVLASWVRSPSIRAGWRSGPDRAAGRRRAGDQRDRAPHRAGRGGLMTWRSCWPPSSRRRSGWGDALVVPAAGRRAGHLQRQGGGRVAGVRPSALAGRDVQVLRRSRAGCQAPRCPRALRLNTAGIFGIITRQAIRRGSFTSVKGLITAIEAFIDGWNDRCQPFSWTKTPDQLLPRCRPGKKSSFTRH